jgi:hypothetical protein
MRQGAWKIMFGETGKYLKNIRRLDDWEITGYKTA